jgi:hypothetical protein
MLLQQRQNYKKPQNGFLQYLRGGKVCRYLCRCLISLHRPGFLMNLQGPFHLEIIYQYSKVQFIPEIFVHFD